MIGDTDEFSASKAGCLFLTLHERMENQEKGGPSLCRLQSGEAVTSAVAEFSTDEEDQGVLARHKQSL